MGVMGACRSNELYMMQNQHLKFFDGCVQVAIPHTKTKVPRKFTVTDSFYQIIKKYADLRPPNVPSDSFFLNFQNGKCTKQIIGINKFGGMGKEIATFLGIENPGRYTGHCLRRSSATLYADGGATMTALKRHGGWRSASTVEGYIADSDKNKLEAARKIFGQINPNPLATVTTTSDSTSTIVSTATATTTTTSPTPTTTTTVNSPSTSTFSTNQCSTTINDNVNFEILNGSMPSICIRNNNNITINFINNH